MKPTYSSDVGSEKDVIFDAFVKHILLTYSNTILFSFYIKYTWEKC